MRRVCRLALVLYPRGWRRRYGAELDALLEDSSGGWRDLCDVFKGAMLMQLKDLSPLPLVGAVVGVVAGLIVYAASPEMYASSAVVRVPGAAHAGLQTALSAVLRDEESRAATHVVIVDRTADTSLVRITHFAGDAERARRTTEALVTAVTTPGSTPAAAVVELPRLPAAAERTGDPWLIAFAAGIGFAGGAGVLGLRRFRTRRTD